MALHFTVTFTFHQSSIGPLAAGYETCHNSTSININNKHKQQYLQYEHHTV
jgi:hypothetical protein